MAVVSVKDLLETHPFPGFTGRFVHGNSMTVAYWNIEAGRRVPEHSHHHEMMINCMSGTFEVTIDGESSILEAGDIVLVPSHAVHSAHAITDCHVIDVFSPVREDYKNLAILTT